MFIEIDVTKYKHTIMYLHVRQRDRQTDAWINSQANNEGGMDGDEYNAQRVSQMIL